MQPVSICGRIDREERERMRITIPDFMKLCEKQTDGAIKVEDFRPVTWPIPISRAVGALKRRRYVEFTAHPHCGVATFFIAEDGGRRIKAINRLTDVDKFAEAMWKVYEEAVKGHKVRARIRMLGSIRYIKGSLLRSLMMNVLTTGAYEALGKVMRRMILLGCMHFMDPYNFDLERINRCCIHYATVDGRIIPFCTMNSIHRQPYELKHSIPISKLGFKEGELIKGREAIINHN